MEREAFEQRLKERDDAKTRKMAEAKLSKEDLADIERRKYANEEERQELLPRLRSFLHLNQPVMLHQVHLSSCSPADACFILSDCGSHLGARAKSAVHAQNKDAISLELQHTPRTYLANAGRAYYQAVAISNVVSSLSLPCKRPMLHQACHVVVTINKMQQSCSRYHSQTSSA